MYWLLIPFLSCCHLPFSFTTPRRGGEKCLSIIHSTCFNLFGVSESVRPQLDESQRRVETAVNQRSSQVLWNPPLARWRVVVCVYSAPPIWHLERLKESLTRHQGMLSCLNLCTHLLSLKERSCEDVSGVFDSSETTCRALTTSAASKTSFSNWELDLKTII